MSEQTNREILIQTLKNGYLVRSPAPYAYKNISDVLDAVKHILEGREIDAKKEAGK